jgi:hypothetical protein
MDNAPQLVQLALGDRQVPPQLQQDLPTMLGRPVQPITDCILVYLHNAGGAPQRIAFGQCSDRRLEDHRFSIQISEGNSGSKR